MQSLSSPSAASHVDVVATRTQLTLAVLVCDDDCEAAADRLGASGTGATDLLAAVARSSAREVQGLLIPDCHDCSCPLAPGIYVRDRGVRTTHRSIPLDEAAKLFRNDVLLTAAGCGASAHDLAVGMALLDEHKDSKAALAAIHFLGRHATRACSEDTMACARAVEKRMGSAKVAEMVARIADSQMPASTSYGTLYLKTGTVVSMCDGETGVLGDVDRSVKRHTRTQVVGRLTSPMRMSWRQTLRSGVGGSPDGVAAFGAITGPELRLNLHEGIGMTASRPGAGVEQASTMVHEMRCGTRHGLGMGGGFEEVRHHLEETDALRRQRKREAELRAEETAEAEEMQRVKEEKNRLLMEQESLRANAAEQEADAQADRALRAEQAAMQAQAAKEETERTSRVRAEQAAMQAKAYKEETERTSRLRAAEITKMQAKAAEMRKQTDQAISEEASRILAL